MDDASFLTVADGRMEVFKNVNFLRFEFTDEAGNTDGVGVNIAQWKPGDSHQITTTWSGNHFYLYVDGQPVSDKAWDGHPPLSLPPDGTLAIGSAFAPGRPIAPGSINDVDVSGRPLSPAEIARRYEAALAAAAAAAQKGKTAAR
jgi:hypothetical protein